MPALYRLDSYSIVFSLIMRPDDFEPLGVNFKFEQGLYKSKESFVIFLIFISLIFTSSGIRDTKYQTFYITLVTISLLNGVQFF